MLAAAIENSCKNQIVLLEKDNLELTSKPRFLEPAKIVVSQKRTFQAAREYKSGKVCVLNFACSHETVGMFEESFTQEEILCRSSTLYFCISQKEVARKFHNAHKIALLTNKMSHLYNDDCIFTPDVVVFKTDETYPKPLPQSEWFSTSVISCAAPNLVDYQRFNSDQKLRRQDYLQILQKRTRRILALAKSQGVDHLVLGAFGCGAFGNNPADVAAAFKKAVLQFERDFKTIEFAVYCDTTESANYAAFAQEFLFSN